MNGSYAGLAKEIPVHGRNGIVKLGAELERDFFGWDSFSLRWCLVDGVGMIPEELACRHTHDYDQILLFLSAEPADQLNLGAEVEVDLGPEGVRHRIAIPHGVSVPKGLPHFSPVVRRLDRPFFFLSVSCTGKMAAAPDGTDAVPGTGPWNKFMGEYSRNIEQLTFAVNDPFHYGSERSQPSGGVSAFLKGGDGTAFPLTTSWTTVHRPHQMGPWKEDGRYHPHMHPDNDEALILLSLDQSDLTDLHGEVEFFAGAEGDDQERFVLTRSTVMAMPHGTYHLPMRFLRVDRPCVFLTVGES